MNILFVGAGKRVTMASLFKARGYNIYSYETSHKLPISSQAEIILGKRWKDPDIISHINQTCLDYSIEMVIPFQDEAIEICSNVTNALTLCKNSMAARVCYDKKLFESFMLHTLPELYPTDLTGYPKIYKPIHGFSSRGIIKSKTYLEIVPDDYVIQRCVDGEEYSVDCYSNAQAQFIDGVPRKRLEVCCGEVTRSATVDYPQLVQYSRHIADELKISGPSCFQYIVDKDTGRPYIMEINCRFGGGCTLSIQAGFDIISIIAAEYHGKQFEYTAGSWTRDFNMIRYHQDYVYG